MARSSRKRSRMVPILSGVVSALTLLVGVVGGLVAADIQAPALANYRPWVWGLFAISSIILVGWAIWERVQSDADVSSAGTTLAANQAYTELRQKYLSTILERFQYLPLRGIDFKTASAETGEDERLRLADVYIQLNTTSKDDSTGDKKGGSQRTELADLLDASANEARPLSALKALIHTQHMVLLGDPGGGKSTFVNHVAFCLANHELESDRTWLERLHGWPDRWRQILPVPIVLREVAAWLQETEQEQQGVGLFRAYLAYWLTREGLEAFYDVLRDCLTSGKALLLLDGLDEVPLVDGAINRIKRMIGDLLRAYKHTSIIVTCRVLSYQDPRWKLNERDWTRFELAKLNQEQIDGFIKAWHGQLAIVKVVTNPDALNAKLSQAVCRTDLARLARNPLLLTVMALVHTHKGELPDARAVLYEDVVELLLWRWDAIRYSDAQGNERTWRQLLQSVNLNDDDVKETLWQLAYSAHMEASAQDDSETTADILEQDLLEGLRELHPQAQWDRPESLKWAAMLVEIIKLRAGPLVETRPQVYSFPHRTFQEYLAGCHLSQLPDFATESVGLSQQGTYWHEAIKLAIGRLVHHNRDIDKSLMLVSELCPANPPQESDANGWRQTGLAGECLLEIGIARATRRRSTGEEIAARLQERLPQAMTIDVLEPRERVESGNVLSRVGDPRNLTELIPIPGGLFIMGTSDEEEEAAIESYLTVFKEGDFWAPDKARDAMQREKPQYPVDLPDFSIAKYPVTNAQYEAFVVATNHTPPQHWPDQQPSADLRNHPVVYVSWDDAVAYCQWLTESNPEHGEVRLPSEAEWEKAARGRDKRLYPWPGGFDVAKCNAGETGINGTSSVGLFPTGVSPYGCLDMAGNVLEWCSSEYRDYPYIADDGREELTARSRCVLRGGAFSDSRIGVRCAFRYARGPDFMLSGVGFRVVRRETARSN
ncbi:MAG: SUMF1/EgtB/PvdO family nonheme iron enzyme [Chloroflexota bacterium]